MRIYSELPQETLIAATLDPRFKSLAHIPVNEHEEAWNCLRAEFYSPPFFNVGEINQDDLGKQIVQEKELPKPAMSNSKKRKRAEDLISLMWEADTNELINSENMNEFEKYKLLPQVNSNVDVMKWWQQHEKTFPVMAAMAKIYLAIPASQASCERSFSTARRICTEIRTSLSPSNVEKLTVLKQNTKLLCVDED